MPGRDTGLTAGRVRVPGRCVTPLCDDERRWRPTRNEQGKDIMEPNTTSLIISCDTCCMRATATCADCVVTHVLSPAAFESVALDDEEMRVVRLLVRAGMMPTLRHSETDAVAAFC